MARSETRLTEGRTVKEYAKAAAVDEETGPVFAERSPVVGDAPNIPTPPFWGVRVRKDYDLRELFPLHQRDGAVQESVAVEDGFAGGLCAAGGREVPADSAQAGR